MAAVPVSDAFVASFERVVRPQVAAEPGWLVGVRDEAIERFAALGFPTRRMEDWRSTSVAGIAETTFRPAARDEGEISREVLARMTFDGAHRLVFIDGHFSEALSTSGELPAGVILTSLAGAIEEHGDAVERHLARHALYRDQAFVALNTAFFRDGAFLYVPRGVVMERPVHLLYLATVGDEPLASYPRTLIVADEASQATVVETFAGPTSGVYLSAPVSEIVLADGSVVDHVREQREGIEAFHVATQQVLQGRSTSFTTRSVSLGARLSRLDVNHVLAGEGGSAVLDGLYLVDGEQHTDTHMTVDHVAANCESHELYKGILDGRGSAVFNGLIHVHPGAQKTNAKQSNRNLLLSREALARSNPQLRIYADDVKCTHGSTVGQLDDDAVFYLRSRGIGPEAARSLLTYAFAAEVVERVRIDAIRERLREFLFNRVPHGDIVRQAV
jgi:Fe-S cluster assembly protein SufD